MSKLWAKSDANSSSVSKWTESFTVGNDYLLDTELLAYDVEASIAHAKGLLHIDILSKEEYKQLETGLKEIQKLHEEGNFKIERHHEDGHTAIEEYLTQKLGTVGKKIHAGRSRNDQVLTALRLYEKKQLAEIVEDTKALTHEFLALATKHEHDAMPGYTHTQPAMLASIGMWAGSFAEMLLASLAHLQSVQSMIDYCPLGSAAGYGVNFDLPREQTSEQLGFKAPITVAMTAQSSRGKWETSIVHSLTTISATLAHFASDLILFSSKEYGFLKIDEQLTTGSSIMPQKKNQDVAELLRAKHHEIVSNEFLLHQLTMRLTSGYHRDLQLTKEPVIKSIRSIKEMITAGIMLTKHLSVDKEALQAKLHPEILAADEANRLVKNGMSFRDAYKEVAKKLDRLEISNVDSLIQEKKHLGATGNLGLPLLQGRLEKF